MAAHPAECPRAIDRRNNPQRRRCDPVRIGAELSWARRTTAALELGQHAEQRPGADHRSAAAGGLPRSDDLSDRRGLQPVGRRAATAPGPGHRTDALIAAKEKPPCRARRLEGCRGVLGPGAVVLMAYGKTISTRRFCGSRTPSAVGRRWSLLPRPLTPMARRAKPARAKALAPLFGHPSATRRS